MNVTRVSCVVVLLVAVAVAALAAPHGATQVNAQAPGRQSHVVILLQGVDSGSGCADSPAYANGFLAREQDVSTALASDPSISAQLIGFSYTGLYYTGSGAGCANGLSLATGVQYGLAARPSYAAPDTCGGVVSGALGLQQLIDATVATYPGAEVDLVGHSMGGLIAAYYIAVDATQSELGQLNSVVLLDSPVQGSSLYNPASACGNGVGSWSDMAPGSGVLAAIQAQACSRFGRFYSVTMTPFGADMPCGLQSVAAGYTSGTSGAVGGGLFGCGVGLLLTLSPAGCLAGAELGTGAGIAEDWAGAHQAVWSDPVALQTIAAALAAPPVANATGGGLCTAYSATTGACVSYGSAGCSAYSATSGACLSYGSQQPAVCTLYSATTGACVSYAYPAATAAGAPGAGTNSPAQFFGTVTFSSGLAIGGGTIQAVVSGIICGTGQTSSAGSYALSLQPIPGCTTPGTTVNFWLVSSGEYALQAGTVPAIAGVSSPLNLVFPV